MGEDVSVQRFLLQENARNFRARLDETADEAGRRKISAMLATVERELALLDATETGVRGPPWPIGSADALAQARATVVKEFHGEFGVSTQIAYLLDPAPGLLIAEVNHAFELATGLARETVVGQPLFAMFPDNPEDPNADGMSRVYASLRRVAETGAPHAMPAMRYDVRDADGLFVERHWRQVNAPLHDDQGRLVYLLHVVDEVTDEVRRTHAGRAPAEQGSANL